VVFIRFLLKRPLVVLTKFAHGAQTLTVCSAEEIESVTKEAERPQEDTNGTKRRRPGGFTGASRSSHARQSVGFAAFPLRIRLDFESVPSWIPRDFCLLCDLFASLRRKTGNRRSRLAGPVGPER
jgi:hypothetical protein